MLWVLKSTFFKYPKLMFKLIDKKTIAILRKLFLLNWSYGSLFLILVVVSKKSKKKNTFHNWENRHCIWNKGGYFRLGMAENPLTWVKCGARLYRFLIFALFLTFIVMNLICMPLPTQMRQQENSVRSGSILLIPSLLM